MKYWALLLSVVATGWAAAPAFAHNDSCAYFDLNTQCDISGWMGLILGDAALALALAIILHVLAHKSNRKIEDNSEKIERIISEQKLVRDRRKIYVVQALKNHFSSMLLCIGIVDRFSGGGGGQDSGLADTKKSELLQIIQRGQSVLELSIDVLDPMLVEQIVKLFSRVKDSMHDGAEGRGIRDYDELKNAIYEMTDRLNRCGGSQDVLK